MSVVDRSLRRLVAPWVRASRSMVSAWIIAVALVTGSIGPIPAPPALAAGPASTFYSESHWDDPIGDGRTVFGTTADSDFRPDPFGGNAIDIGNSGSTHHWEHEFVVASDERLVTGQTYDGSVRVRGPIAGYGGSCSSAEASVSVFQIHDVAYDAAGNLALLSMSVRQRCGAGDYRAEIRFNTSLPTFAAVLPSPNPYFSFDFGRLGFPSTAIGSSSARKTIELTSVGSRPVEIGAASISGKDTADFRITDNNCSGHQLTPGQTCTFALRFGPTARGDREALASIQSDTPSGGKQWPIHGYGQIATTTTIDAPTEPVLSPVLIKGRVQPVPEGLPGTTCLYLREDDKTWGGFGVTCDESGRGTFDVSLTSGQHVVHVASQDTTDYASSRSSNVTVNVIREKNWATAVVSPLVFYPIVDNYRDRLTVEGTRKQPVAVEIVIKSVATGEIVHESSVPAATGGYLWWWDGTGGTGAGPLDPGKYDVRVTLSDSVPNVRVITRQITLSHDYVTWKTRSVALSGSRYTLRGTTRNAAISTAKSRYSAGVLLNSNKGSAAVVYVFPVQKAKIYGVMKFEVQGKSTNRHKALIAVWNKTLGGYRDLGNYDAAKIIGPGYKWWRTKTEGQVHVKKGKARATVVVWKGLGRSGRSIFDIRKVRLAYKVGTLHPAAGASVADSSLETELRAAARAAATGPSVAGVADAGSLPKVRLRANPPTLPADEPALTEEPTASEEPEPTPVPTEGPTPDPTVEPKPPPTPEPTPQLITPGPTPDPTPENQAPVADAGGPYKVDEGDTVKLDGRGSSDPDGDIVAYEWTKKKRLDDPTNKRPVFSAVDDDVVEIELTVTDDRGATDTASAKIKVRNVDPKLAEFGPFEVTVSEELVIDAIVIRDPGVRDIHQATVDWGDGTSSTAAISEDGISASASHTYSEAGQYAMKISVTDDDGGGGSRKTWVSVTGLPAEEPVAAEAEDVAD